MKKIILIFLGLGLLSACTSREQAAEIELFWMKQFAEVQEKFLTGQLNKQNMSPKIQAYLDAIDSGQETIPQEDSIDEGAPIQNVVAKKFPAKKSVKAPAPVAAPDPIPAQLFLSDSCGWCKKLKGSGFPEKFKRKYVGEVDLQVYEVHSKQGGREFAKAIKKHNLSGGVPLLVIGNSVIHGYSDQMMELADEKVRLELKKRGPVVQGPAVVSITMEDDILASPASAADKAKMQAYLAKVRDNNEAVLNSVQSMFSGAVWDQALRTVTDTEHQLNQLATESTSYDDFVKSAKGIEAAQQRTIEQLIRQNAKKIR